MTNIRYAQVRKGGVPNVCGLPLQRISWEAAEGGGGHRRQQPDNPPQLQGRVSSRGSAKYKNTERISALIPVAEQLSFLNILYGG